MNPSDPTIPYDQMLEHQGFLRRLARALVEDRDAADDLVQETWLVALEHGPKPKGWLVRVLRNLAINRRIADERRFRRERRVARPEQGPTQDDVDEQLETQRRVLDAVLALTEPWKTAIYLRYYRALGPTAISRRLNIPVPTVKARLARGRELVRRKLDREFGTRRAWFASLALYGVPRTTLFGVLFMNMSLKVGAAAVIAGLGALLIWSVAETPPSPEVPVGAGEAQPIQGSLPDSGDLTAPQRTVVAGGQVANPETDAAAVRPGTVRALVLDFRGRPVSGVRLRILLAGGGERSSAPSDVEGIALLPAGPGGGTIIAADPELTTLLSGHADDPSGRTTPVVVVGVRQTVAGMVVDEAGVPVPEVDVRVGLPQGFRSRFSAVMDQSLDVESATATDADGRFTIPWVGGLDGCVLAAHLVGHARHAEHLPPYGTGNLVITLQEPTAEETVIAGMVLDPHGQPTADARVSLGGEVAITDARGGFKLERNDPGRSRGIVGERLAELAKSVTAIKPGYLPAQLEVDTDPVTGIELWPEYLILRLGEKPFDIGGSVVDDSGQAIAGAEVWIDDPSFFSTTGAQSLEAVLGDSDDDRWHVTRTDEHGGFRLRGLLDREYRLGAFDSETMLQAYVPDVSAGREDVRIILDRKRLLEELVGRVVTGDGEALGGAQVNVMMEMVRPIYLGQEVRSSTYLRRRVTTDDQGRFELGKFPADGLQLFIQSSDTFPEWIGQGRGAELGEFAEDGELLVTVSRRMHVQVILDDPAEAERVGVLDNEGQPTWIHSFRVKGGPKEARALLTDGRSEVFAVRDDVRTVVLYRGEDEVRRVPVVLRADGITVVR